MINISRTAPATTPSEIASSDEERSKVLPGYQKLELKPLAGLNGYRFSYKWTPSSAVQSTVTEAFISVPGHMLYLLVGAPSSVYDKQSSIVSHFFESFRTS